MSYADDTTPYSNGHNVAIVPEGIEVKEKINSIEDTSIKNSFSKKLLEVLIAYKLTFNNHVSKLCVKAG